MKPPGCYGGRRAFTVRLSRLFLIVLSWLGPASPADAGSISLELAANASVASAELTVTLSVRNKGDEAAHSVTPACHFRDQTVAGEIRPLLRPGETLEANLKLPVPELGTGRWPYRITVSYTDANAYPLHALHVGTVTVGVPPPGKLGMLEAAADALATSGSLRVRLKNLSADPRRVTVGVQLPDSIESPSPVPAVELAPWEEREVEVPLLNRGALPGSRYAVFATAEYDDGAVHQSVIVPTTLEIVAAQSLFRRYGNTLWVLAGVLLVAWAGVVIWWMTTGRRQPTGT